MNKILQILIFVLPMFGFSQTDTVAHIYTFGGLNNDVAEDAEATTDGGYIVVGSTSSNSYGNTDVYLLKVDSNCGYQWSKAIGGTNNDWGYSVKQTFDKGYIIASTTNSYGIGYNARLIKRDSLGNFLWDKIYGGTDWDFAYDVIQTHDSGFAFCGETYNNTKGYSDVYIVKTNNVGDTLWTKTIGNTLVDKGNAIIETSDSNIVVAGLINTILDSTQAYIIKLDFNGNLLWDSAYGGLKYDKLNKIIETSNGNYVAVGSTNSSSTSGDLDYYLLKITPNGNTLVERTLTPPVPNDDELFDVREMQNGNFVNVGGNGDGVLFVLDPNLFWIGMSLTFGGNQPETIKGITKGNNGSFLLSGTTESYGFGQKDVMLVKLDTFILSMDTSIYALKDFIPLKVEHNYIENQIEIYPNPSSNILNLRFKNYSQYKKINIYNSLGKKVYTFLPHKNLYSIDIKTLKSGIYFLKSENLDKKYIIKRFVVNH